jgi:hypothetical protein
MSGEDDVSEIKFDPNTLAGQFLINPDILNKASPTIPSGFPKNLIPLEKCQIEMGRLLDCMIEHKFDNVECNGMQKSYYICKNWRDSLIFKRIKEWETEMFDFMSENEKNVYLQSMMIKKKTMIDKYEKLPVIPKTRGQRIRISSDIEQIDWRIKYCNDLLNNTYRV